MVFYHFQFKTILREAKKYRPWISSKEILYTIPAGIYVLFGIYFIYVVISYVDRTNPSVQEPISSRTRLLDPLLDSLSDPFNSSGLPKTISDLLVFLSFVLIVIRALINGRKTLLLTRRLCYTIGTMYLLRAPFIVMTYLPNPLLYCQSIPDPDIFYDALLLVSQKRTSCGDVLFSGHTVVFMTVGMLYVDYPIFKNAILHFMTSAIFIIFSFLSCLSLIASSYHYTVDVVIAVFLTFTIWKFYHLAATSSYFENTWYGKILQAIDQGNTLEFGNIPYSNAYEMKFPA